jgi:hypothetical protein
MRAKYFRLKLSDMAEQLKTIRYTVQRTRNFNSNFVISDQKKVQKFKDAYLKFNLLHNEQSNLVENSETTRLFSQRYKHLYLNVNSENKKMFSYR